MLLDALHLMSAAIWLGALLALLVMTPDGEWASWFRSAGRVYSRWALGSMGILALSGIAMATDYASSWRGFLASDWGKAVIWKAIGLTGIVALGAWQRRSLRRMAERVESFAVRAWLELAVGASILLVAAVLIDLNPLADIFPEAVTRDGVEAKISIEPFSVGNNTVTIRFSHDAGFEQVKMRFYMPPDASVLLYPAVKGSGESHLWAYLLDRLGWLPLEQGAALAMSVANIFILFGLGLLIVGWRQVWRPRGELVTHGLYGLVRHPQYSGLILVTTGWIIMWPTLLTLIMYPFIIRAYARLAAREDGELRERFGPTFERYREQVPTLWPRRRNG